MIRNKLTFNDYVQPIGLPSKDTLIGATKATVIGWGGILHWVSLGLLTNQSKYIIKDPTEGEAADTNVLSCHLKEAEVDVTVPTFLGWMIDGTCEALVFHNFQTKLCAGKSGVDSCQGDSG